ncbi:MAG: T9SS type A sorting domain-containing protein [Bacteroidales bacterium]|nr:T9SS type A sorting domain-containing protein [Bacteroidales bacterium]
MKKTLPIRKFVLIAALMMPLFALFAQNTSDTITGDYIGYSPYSVLPGSYGFHISACLYEAGEINHEAGNITSLSYSIAPGNGYDFEYSTAKIWLIETSEETLDLSQSWYDITNSATLVYDGSLDNITPFDYYWHEFPFSQAFAYTGGNLIVLVEGVMSNEYYGGTDYEIALYTNDSDEDHCWVMMQDDEMFDIHEVMSGLSGSFHSSTTERPDIFFTFGGNTTHDCFLNIPYSDDFQSYEAYAAMPECWTRISEEYNEYLGYYTPCVGPGSAADNYDQSLFFTLMDTDAEYAILPRLADGYSIQDLTMSFRFKTAQQNTTVVAVGVMTNPDNPSTFELVQTVSREGTSFGFENKEINFAAYTGDGRYIALLLSREYSSSLYPSCFIDDINVEASAFCTPPVDIVADVDGDYVTVSWTYTNNAQGAKLYYKSEEDTDFEEIEIAEEDYNIFESLPAGTTYEFYIVSVCGEDEVSAASATYTFTTSCEAITEFPWSESFENGVSCWTLNSSAAGQNWALVSAGGHADFNNTPYQPYSGNNMMQFNAWQFTAGNWGTLTSPQIDLSQVKTLTFQYHTCGQEEIFDFDLFEEYPDNEEMWWKPMSEKIEVYVSGDGSVENASLLTTVNGYSESFGWKSATVSIPAQEEFGYIIFKAYYEDGYNMAIDNIVVSDGTHEYENIPVNIDTAICEGSSVVIGGETFSIGGTYQIIVSHENEGDTVITLNLTVNPTFSMTYEATINEGETYTEHGFNESQGGTYHQYLETVNGCDSVITLVLTVTGGTTPDPVFVTLDASICNGETYEFNGNTYSAEGTHTVVSGDTTYTIVITVNPTYNITINDSVAPGETYNNHGFNVGGAGTYVQNLETVNGCDSVITLVLTETVGIESFGSAAVTISPNPATDYFAVSVKNVSGAVSVELLDISGRTLRRETMDADGTPLRISRGGLPAGIYMLRLTSGNCNQTRKVILK